MSEKTATYKGSWILTVLIFSIIAFVVLIIFSAVTSQNPENYQGTPQNQNFDLSN